MTKNLKTFRWWEVWRIKKKNWDEGPIFFLKKRREKYHKINCFGMSAQFFLDLKGSIRIFQKNTVVQKLTL